MKNNINPNHKMILKKFKRNRSFRYINDSSNENYSNASEAVLASFENNNKDIYKSTNTKTKACTYDVYNEGMTGTAKKTIGRIGNAIITSDGNEILSVIFSNSELSLNNTNYSNYAQQFNVNVSDDSGCPKIYIICKNYVCSLYNNIPSDISNADSVRENSVSGTINTGDRNLNYDKICSIDGVRKAMKILGYVVLLAKWIAPLIIIVLGVIDFTRAVASDDEKATSKAMSALIRRLLAGIIIFFIPNLILGLLNVIEITGGMETGEFYACTKCLVKVKECGEPAPSSTNTGVNSSGEVKTSADSNRIDLEQ